MFERAHYITVDLASQTKCCMRAKQIAGNKGVFAAKEKMVGTSRVELLTPTVSR